MLDIISRKSNLKFIFDDTFYGNDTNPFVFWLLHLVRNWDYGCIRFYRFVMKLKKYSCLAPNPELLKNLETQMYFFLLLSFLLFLFPSFEFRFENRFKVTTETRKYDEPIKLRKFVEPFYKLKNILESFLNST